MNLEKNSWPWWTWSSTEGSHWSSTPHGGSAGGLFWRHVREICSRNSAHGNARQRHDALSAHDKPWIDRYGWEAHEEALHNTQQKFEESCMAGDTADTIWAAALA